MKRLLALSLSLLLAAALTMSVPIAGFAAEEPQCPLLVNITTDRSSYSTLGIAEFTVTVTNGSQAAVDGISAELLAGQLAPLGSKSVIKAESECLLPGESIGFMFKAALNKETVALNAFQRFGLGFIRLWYKNMPVADNGFDNGRTHSDTSKTIKFAHCSEIFFEFSPGHQSKAVWGFSGSAQEIHAEIKIVSLDHIHGDYLKVINNRVRNCGLPIAKPVIHETDSIFGTKPV